MLSKDTCERYHLLSPNTMHEAEHQIADLLGDRYELLELLACFIPGSPTFVEHAYNETCPDENGIDSRDPSCPKCQLLMRVKAVLEC